LAGDGDLRQIRVLIAKPGLDGHDRAAHLIARVLRDGGMEVVYGGLRQTPAMIAETAIQEDVQVIGLSILSGGHLGLARRTMESLREADVDAAVVIGGVIPEEDVPKLLDLGIAAVFPSTTPLAEIVERVRELGAGPVPVDA
jgi:methylmalonyl-CoA mutase C-terminal domain/subunit